MSISLTQVNPNGNPTGSYLFGRAISNDGQVITVTDAVSSAPYYFETADGGATWAGKTGYPAPAGYPSYARIAASADGAKKIAVCNYGQSFRSVDGGQSWSTCAPGGSTISRYFSSCAISADGTVMLICVQNGRAYRSIDSGASWSEMQPAGAANQYWNVAGISDDGLVMVLGIGDGLAGRAYISTNGGSSWALLDPNGYGDALKWTSAALSSDGNKILLTSSTGNGCFVSSDKGATWRYAWPPTGSYDGINRAFYSAAVSADGQKILTGGMISSTALPFLYSSEDGGATWADVTPAGGGSYQPFLALHINRTGTAGYAAQTAGGKCWIFGYTAANAEVDVPAFEVESKIETGGAIITQGAVIVPELKVQSSFEASVFSGWEADTKVLESQAEAKSNGGGFCVLGGIATSIAAMAASVMIYQAEVPASAMMAESRFGGDAYMGKWIDAPEMRSEAMLDFVVAPGWQEMRPAGSFNMPIVGYYPSKDDRVIMVTAAGDWFYVFRTLDGGVTWLTVPNIEFDSLGIGPCAISGDGRTMLVTGISETSPVLAVSRDYGSTWETISIYQDWSTASIAISDDGAVILVCGSYNSSRKSKGWISRDNGRTWQRIYPMGHINTVDGHTELNECWKFAISGNGTVILAASKELYEYEGGQYVKQPDQTWFRTIDGGITWERMPVLYDSQSPVTEMSLNFDGSIGLFAINNRLVSAPSPYRWLRLFNMQTADDWDTSEVNPGFSIDVNRPWYCATSGKPDGATDEQVLVGEMWGGRLWYSGDSGASYSEIRPAGNQNIDWKKVWIRPSGRLIADCWNPYLSPQRRILYMSDDGGANWLPEVTGRMGYLGWGACAMSGDGVVMLAGRNGGSIHMSRDRGGTWAEIPPGFGMDRQWAAIDISADGAKILVGSNHQMEGARIWISRDRGDNWAEVELPEKEMDQFPAVGMSRDRQHMLAAYASTYAPGYVIYSDDAGQNWRRVWPEGSNTKVGWDWVRAFNGGLLLVGIDEWIYRSFDGGNTWTRTNIAQNTDHNSIVGLCGNENGAILYAGVFRGRVWRSYDYGDSWEEVPIAGNIDGCWYGLSCNSAAGYLLFADNGGRVWRSKDSGQTWVDQRVQGDRNSNWSGTAIDETGEIMIACTDDHLFYAYDIVRPGGPVYIVDIIGGLASEGAITFDGAMMGFFPIVPELASETVASGESGIWNDKGVKYRYRCYVSKAGYSDVEIACTVIQCTLNSEGQNYLSVSVPGVIGLGDTLLEYQDGGKITVFMEAINSDGAMVRSRVAVADIGSIRQDVGSDNRNVTISGYFPAMAVEEYRQIKTTYEAVLENGRRQWRPAGIPLGLRAGNILMKPGSDEQLKADHISIYIRVAGTQIDITGA